MQQWKIQNNQIYPILETDLVGFSYNSYYPILKDFNKVLIFRTALGVGDWVMLERLPKAIKSYYPNCKVYLPSPKMLKQIFGPMLQQWSSWGDVSRTVELVFKNNPYIDDYVDEWEGEIYTDHYRIYDETLWKTPLVRQMARFYNIPDSFEIDDKPMLYFDEEEIKEGEKIINNNYCDSKQFNFLHISNRNTEKDEQVLLNYIHINDLDYLPYLYYGLNSNDTAFRYLNIKGNINYINNPRIQFYIKSKAQNVIGNQTGATDVVCGLTQVHSLHHSTTLEETFRVGNYLPPIKYINRNDKIST